MTDYVYRGREATHRRAVDADEADPMFYRSAFVRFRPISSHGALSGRNSLTASWAEPAAPSGASPVAASRGAAAG